MQIRLLVRAGAALALAGLAACGGGGGGRVGAASGPATTPLSGVATYALVPNPRGALEYALTSTQPVRGATVDVLEAGSGAIVASTTTGEDGAYAVLVPPGTTVSVRIRAQMAQAGSGPHWDVSVRDNTQSNAIYAMESPTFSVQQAAIARDLHAPSGWGGSNYSAPRVAAPFAILDTIRTAMAKVQSVAPDASFPPLRVFWSVNNVPASGRIALGQIGTTSYSSDASGPVIYVLGKENVDTDEYDAPVIAHEWGHYYQHAFSRDDSPGGAHGFNDLLDQRLAFSEGWGNAWSGIALGRSSYTDSIGAGQGLGTDLELSDGAPTRPGWFREASAQAVLWRLNARFGFGPIHSAMSGPLRTTRALTTIHAFAAAYASAQPAGQGDLAAALVANGISGVTIDPWGALESNDGGIPSSLPLYRPASVGAPMTTCVTNAAGAGNKLGSHAYLRFAAPASRAYEITVNGPPASDPDFAVYAGGQIAASEGPGASETATVSLSTGETVLALHDANSSSASTCFSVSIQ